MIQGKHQKRSHGRSVRSTALLVSLVLLLTVAVGGTIAFLIASDGPLVNLFNPSQVTTHVEETIEGDVKKDVKIQNTGDTDAWIRAAVVITWQDKDGNVYGQMPDKDTDYSITYNLGEQLDADGNVIGKWEKGTDGFYYWNSPVVAQTGVTGELIATCTYLKNAPEGYYLSVEIIGSGIQSKPASVFNTEWASSGLTVKDTDEQENALAPEVWTLVKSEKEEP